MISYRITNIYKKVPYVIIKYNIKLNFSFLWCVANTTEDGGRGIVQLWN